MRAGRIPSSVARDLAALPELAAARQDVLLDAAGVPRYVRGFTYRRGPDEERPIAELRRRLAGLG